MNRQVCLIETGKIYYERFGYSNMKRVLVAIMTTFLTAATVVGCGNSTDGKNLSSIELEKYVTNIGEYKGLEISGTKTEVTDEYVESYIDYILENSKETKDVTERAVMTGDVVNIDYVGTKDGIAFEGGTAQGYDLEIGSGSFIDGFEDGLIGCNIGDTVDLNLTFPEQYHSEELAGQDVVFTVTINSISELVKPELTDEYVQSIGMEECQTVEQFYDVVRTSLEEDATFTYENELQVQIAEKVMENCEFSEEVPESLLNYYKEQISANIENSASSIGLELSDFLIQYYGMTLEQFEEEVETQAADSARLAMAYALIAKKENIEVTDDELNKNIEENYANFGYESVEAFMQQDDPEDYRDYLLKAKVRDLLMENAVISEVETQDAVATETMQEQTAATQETAE